MAKPARAVVTCMDYRVKEEVILKHLGWELERAFILRNAGGAVTQDVIRSLMLLQKFVLAKPPPSGEGTYDIEIAVVAHTDCGMRTPDGGEDDLRRKIERDFWICETPPFALETFLNPQLAVRRAFQRLRTSRFVSSRTDKGLRLSGYVYDVDANPQSLKEVRTHVVTGGQDWDKVAAIHKITVEKLKDANPQAKDEARTGVGQVLYIPS
jgi:carbonic anhydrase